VVFSDQGSRCCIHCIRQQHRGQQTGSQHCEPMWKVHPVGPRGGAAFMPLVPGVKTLWQGCHYTIIGYECSATEKLSGCSSYQGGFTNDDHARGICVVQLAGVLWQTCPCATVLPPKVVDAVWQISSSTIGLTNSQPNCKRILEPAACSARAKYSARPTFGLGAGCHNVQQQQLPACHIQHPVVVQEL